jgi:hypothetical protein
MYGYLDESGTPGVATRLNDYFVVSLVIFSDKASAEGCSMAIDQLRTKLKIPEGYEFHFSRNATKATDGFVKLLPSLDFRFITIAIRKSGSRRKASYTKIAKYLSREVASRFPHLHVEMDSNPILYAEFRRQAKIQKLEIKFKQVKSRNHNLIQLADYVVALSSRKLKGTSRALEQYRPIANKTIVFMEITE